MPTIFKTTQNVLTGVGEHWDENWLDSDVPVYPPREEWPYDREMQIEDVYLWEQIAEPWDIGVYAAYDPYAEFYLIRHEKNYNYDGWKPADAPRTFSFETFYGPGAQQEVYKRMKELGFPLTVRKVWIDDDKMWLYQNQQ
jgi:hypothetical protein